MGSRPAYFARLMKFLRRKGPLLYIDEGLGHPGSLAPLQFVLQFVHEGEQAFLLRLIQRSILEN
jgi:hypothetical protein